MAGWKGPRLAVAGRAMVRPASRDAADSGRTRLPAAGPLGAGVTKLWAPNPRYPTPFRPGELA